MKTLKKIKKRWILSLILLIAAAFVITSVIGCTNSDSSPTTTTVYQPEGTLPQIYALFVGINAYPEGSGCSALDYAVNDAYDLNNSLQPSAYWKAVGSDRFVCTDKSASKSNIQQFILKYKSEATATTQFVMTYSGHGSNDGNDTYLVVLNSDGTQLATISPGELASWVASGENCNATVILDCCFSGGMLAPPPPSMTKDATTNIRVYTGMDGYDPNFSLGWQWPEDKYLSDVKNLVAISACTYEEVSYETSSFENGVFTYFLLDGLSEEASVIGPADTNRDGLITMTELFGYAAPETYDYSMDHLSSTMTPQISDTITGTFRIK